MAAQARASLTACITAGKYKVMDQVVGDGHAVGRAGSAKSAARWRQVDEESETLIAPAPQ